VGSGASRAPSTSGRLACRRRRRSGTRCSRKRWFRSASARAHFQLAKNADQRGDTRAQLQHLKAAVDSNPDEPRYWCDSHAQRKSEPARFRGSRHRSSHVFRRVRSPPRRQLPRRRIVRFERRGYFDRLRGRLSGRSLRFRLRHERSLRRVDDAGRRLALAREMATALPANKIWPPAWRSGCDGEKRRSSRAASSPKR
jgi:hypothetical protein